ncbi:MAG: hypothetical protein AB7K71_03715 [Polyangiaceae bacterium]
MDGFGGVLRLAGANFRIDPCLFSLDRRGEYLSLSFGTGVYRHPEVSPIADLGLYSLFGGVGIVGTHAHFGDFEETSGASDVPGFDFPTEAFPRNRPGALTYRTHSPPGLHGTNSHRSEEAVRCFQRPRGRKSCA